MSLKIALAVYNRNHILCLKCQSEVVSVKQRRDAQLTTTQIYLRPLVSFREISKEINSRLGMFWLSSYRSDQNHQNWWSCSCCSSWEGPEITLTTNTAYREVETIWFPLPTSFLPTYRLGRQTMKPGVIHKRQSRPLWARLPHGSGWDSWSSGSEFLCKFL